MSKQAEHTPGPWTHRQSPVEARGYRCVYFSTKRDEPYCTSALLPSDARLIAAAPDLLAACEAQHDALDFLLAMLVQRDADFRPTQCPAWGAVLKGNSAIAKAKGATP